MKIKINPRTSLPEIEYQEEDFNNLIKVQQMFASQGWLVFKQYLEDMRKRLWINMKAGISKSSNETATTKIAIVTGFEHFLELEDKINLKIAEMSKTNETISRKEGDKNEQNDYGD